jgi:hypothetical protein
MEKCPFYETQTLRFVSNEISGSQQSNGATCAQKAWASTLTRRCRNALQCRYWVAESPVAETFPNARCRPKYVAGNPDITPPPSVRFG